MEAYKSYRAFCRRFPLWQSFHTGLWGWEQVYDCANLNKALFGSRQAAGRDRKQGFMAQHY